MRADPVFLHSGTPQAAEWNANAMTDNAAEKFDRVCKLLDSGVITRQDALRLLDMNQEQVCAVVGHHMHAVIVPLEECPHPDCQVRWVMES